MRLVGKAVGLPDQLDVGRLQVVEPVGERRKAGRRGVGGGRDVAGSGRRSAHATAAAIDVSDFVLADGRRISVEEDWNGGDAQERAFLRTVHQSACKRFDTVLGPDYNAAHRDHFHVERGGGRVCR